MFKSSLPIAIINGLNITFINSQSHFYLNTESMEKNLIKGDRIEILCHNQKENKDEWLRGYFYEYQTALDIDFRIKCKLETGQLLEGVHPDCVRVKKLNSVTVHFEESKFDYTTNVSAAATEEGVKKYFVGRSFDLGTYPNELFKKCTGITFIDNNILEFTIRFEGRKAGAIGALSKFTETVKADNLDTAILRLYDNYEHIAILTVNGEKYDYNKVTPTYGGIKLQIK